MDQDPDILSQFLYLLFEKKLLDWEEFMAIRRELLVRLETGHGGTYLDREAKGNAVFGGMMLAHLIRHQLEGTTTDLIPEDLSRKERAKYASITKVG